MKCACSWALAPALSALGRLSALTLKPREASRLLGRAAHLPALAHLELIGIDCQGAGARRTLLALLVRPAPGRCSVQQLCAWGALCGTHSGPWNPQLLAQPCWRFPSYAHVLSYEGTYPHTCFMYAVHQSDRHNILC